MCIISLLMGYWDQYLLRKSKNKNDSSQMRQVLTTPSSQPGNKRTQSLQPNAVSKNKGPPRGQQLLGDSKIKNYQQSQKGNPNPNIFEDYGLIQEQLMAKSHILGIGQKNNVANQRSASMRPQIRKDSKPKEIYNQIKKTSNFNNKPIFAQQRTNKPNEMEMTKPSKKKAPLGLPNVGNTCHLNSILQFLFSVPQFRKFIINKSNTMDNSKTVKIMAQIFKLLSSTINQDRYDDKKKLYLQKFIQNLEKMNLNYKRYQQEDAFETLNNILNNLEYSASDKKRIQLLFTLQTRIKCRKCMEGYVLLSSMFPSLHEKCEECKIQFDKKYQNTPDYLILAEPKIERQCFLDKNEYKFLSSILYTGSGKSGHYECLRNQEGVYYEISDRSVKEVRDSELNWYFKQSNSSHGSKYTTFYRKPIATLYIKQNLHDKGGASKQNDMIDEKDEVSKRQKEQMKKMINQLDAEKKRKIRELESLEKEFQIFYKQYLAKLQKDRYYKWKMEWWEVNKDWIRQKWPEKLEKIKNSNRQLDFYDFYRS